MTLKLDTVIYERVAFLKEQRSLILAEIEQLKREPLQITTIAGQIDRLQQNYNRLVEEETALTPGPFCDPLDVLPPELWASIMPDSLDEILNLTMVSSRWCQALLSLPVLWSTIILDDTKEDYLAKAIACLELSRPMEIALRIELRPSLELWTEIAPTILAESNRIRSLRFYAENGWMPVIVWDFLAKFETLPALRHLHLPLLLVSESEISKCTIFGISPRLEEVAGVQFNAGTLADPAFKTLRGVIDIGPVDKEMAAALTGMNHVSSLHISESWLVKYGAHSRYLGPLRLPSVTRVEYRGHSLIHAMQFIGDNLVEFILKVNIGDVLKLLMGIDRFSVLRRLDVVADMDVKHQLNPRDTALARPSSSLRNLQLYFDGAIAWDHMTKQEAIEYLAGREEMFTSIFSLLVTTIPNAQTVQLNGRFMVDPALKYTRSLRSLQSLTIGRECRLRWEDEAQRIASLPYLLPPKFLDQHHSLSKLHLYNPALRSHYQILFTYSVEELDFPLARDTMSSVSMPSITTLSLVMASPVLFDFEIFSNLQSIELSGDESVVWASDIFEEIILRPNQWPFLENIHLSGQYIEWDVLILMLERRNFVTESNVKRIKTLEFGNRLPYKLLYPITQLLEGKFVERPPLIELSIQAIGNHLQDPTLTGCQECIRTFWECNSASYSSSLEILGVLFLPGDRCLGWHYELPFERVHPDPPLSLEAVQCLEGKRRRRLEFKLSCKEAEKEFSRLTRCPESMMTAQSKMTVGAYYIDGVSMDTVF